MKTLLKQYFGYDEFRPLQEEIINNILDKKDSFVLMSTGGGKSLCYQLPALKFEGLTIVISPLIALMKDQVDSLKACGINAEYINSSLLPGEIQDICVRAKKGSIKILYIAPERFALKNFQDFLHTLDVSLIAIDEAHCISEWGHDFRPDYRNLSLLKKIFLGVPIITLTATATKKVQADILKQLSLSKAKVFVSSFNRENLNISIIEKKQALEKLVHLLDRYKKESVIIYCFSRKETEQIAENLKLNGFNARAYHAGLDPNKRKLVQELFVKDEIDIIVATIAFGMGIDKPDVRLVVHYTFPKTLEGYYQEIGRAGRDGLPSECIMFYTYADTRKHRFFINQINDTQTRERQEEKLSEVLNYNELSTCRKKYLLNYFGEETETDNCGQCDICLTPIELVDITTIAKKIISAVVRVENRFGKNYIVDVLLGKKSQRILRNKHNQLSVYSIVDDYSESQIRQIAEQLVNLNYLIKSEGEYPTISITKKGAEFLQQKEKLEVQKTKDETGVQKTKNKGALDYNKELFEILRTKRKDIAQSENVPPFVIFGDTALQEMAYYFPHEEKEFLDISGVGAKKLEKYGEDFLQTINKFAKKNHITPITKEQKSIISRTIQSTSPKQKFYEQTKYLLQKQISVERIAKKLELTPGTIINHIEKLVDAGEQIDLEYLKLPSNRYQTMKNAFDECGDEKLKPVFEFLKGKYSYNELKLARVLWKKDEVV